MTTAGEAEVKAGDDRHAAVATLLVDGTKLRVRGLSVIAPVGDVDEILAHGITAGELAGLGWRAPDEASGAG